MAVAVERVKDPMRSEAGFSLAELLVSIGLTLAVLAIALTTFSNTLIISETAALVVDTNENLRVGINFLTRDLIQTGGGIPTGGVPIPSGTGAVPVNRPSPPGQAYTFADVALPAVSPGAALGPLVNGQPGQTTDIITVLYSDITLPLNSWPLTNISADGSRATVDVRTPITNPDTAIRAGDLILFSNAQGNALQAVTGTDGGQIMQFDVNDPLRLNQPAADEGTIVQLQNPPGAYPLTSATRVFMMSYYIDAADVANPRLVRQINARPGAVIALGAENLQLSYDLVDGVTNPTNQKTPPAANSPNQIRKVNVVLMGRSELAHSMTRQFVRNMLSTQVSLRSLSFVDRYW